MSNEQILNPQNIYNFDKLIESDETNFDTLNDGLKYLFNKIDKLNFLKKLRNSIETIESALKLTTTNTPDICISFNGGKDCCVVLYLYYLISSNMNLDQHDSFKINLALFEISDEFDELKKFNENLLKNFYSPKNLNIIRISNTKIKMKECLSIFKHDYPNYLYILMGTRRGDSLYTAKLREFHETDSDWPYFIRVNPILDWTYSELWYFIKRLNVPYCNLYDAGYTSLGNPMNTVRNEALFDVKSNSYQPAYLLDDMDKERNSRI